VHGAGVAARVIRCGAGGSARAVGCGAGGPARAVRCGAGGPATSRQAGRGPPVPRRRTECIRTAGCHRWRDPNAGTARTGDSGCTPARGGVTRLAMSRVGTLSTRIVVLLVLLLRPLLAMPAFPAPAGLDGLLGASICHADSGSADPVTPSTPAGKPVHDCVLCPGCVVPQPHGVAPTPAAVVASVAPAGEPFFALPPPTGPPARRTLAARPRGPPV